MYTSSHYEASLHAKYIAKHLILCRRLDVELDK